MSASDKPPRGVVLDAGPLIALAYRRDRDHAGVRRGFEALLDRQSRLIAPLPIVFEVHKWLLYQVGAPTAHAALTHMRHALELVFPNRTDFDDVSALVAELGPRWHGSLEDALVAITAVRLDLPAWTLNYRDLSAFPRLQLWTPE